MNTTAVHLHAKMLLSTRQLITLSRKMKKYAKLGFYLEAIEESNGMFNVHIYGPTVRWKRVIKWEMV